MEQQSPVDITGYVSGGEVTLSFEYSGQADHLANAGEFVKVNYDDGGGIVLDGRSYQVAEAHSHNPSEHTIEGERFALEMHLVHRDGSGRIAVVGVLFREGESNAAIQAIIDSAPGEDGATSPASGLGAADFLPEGRGYYSYIGSLTTPPYTEGVRWHVMADALEVSADQVRQLAALTGGGTNSRPLQLLNGRQITARGMS